MNIFVLDSDIKKCAQYHVDKHCVKMLVEHLQLLSSTYYFTGQDELAPYRLTHKNHPCSIWCRESLSNWKWLRDMTLELYVEYQNRYNNKNHKSGELLFDLVEPNLVDIGLTPFKLAMPEEYHNSDAVVAYRDYYNGEKRHLFNWKHGNIPEWVA